MLLSERKEMLKSIILDKSYDSSSIMYMVIKPRYLDEIIERIDKKSKKYNKLDSNKFINLFQKFIETFMDKFFYLCTAHFVIEEVISTNFSKIEDYFNLDNEVLQNSEIVDAIIYKIFINNFISNTKYIPSIEILLKEENIPIKKIEEYSFEEAKDIFNLLSKLTFCRNGRNVFELFNNVDMRLKRYGSNRGLSKRKKIQIDKYNDKILNRYIRQYDSIIKSYNSKKRYLKYFMEYK